MSSPSVWTDRRAPGTAARPLVASSARTAWRSAAASAGRAPRRRLRGPDALQGLLPVAGGRDELEVLGALDRRRQPVEVDRMVVGDEYPASPSLITPASSTPTRSRVVWSSNPHDNPPPMTAVPECRVAPSWNPSGRRCPRRVTHRDYRSSHALTTEPEDWQPLSLVSRLLRRDGGGGHGLSRRAGIRFSAGLMVQVTIMALLGPGPAVASALLSCAHRIARQPSRAARSMTEQPRHRSRCSASSAACCSSVRQWLGLDRERHGVCGARPADLHLLIGART